MLLLFGETCAKEIKWIKQFHAKIGLKTKKYLQSLYLNLIDLTLNCFFNFSTTLLYEHIIKIPWKCRWFRIYFNSLWMSMPWKVPPLSRCLLSKKISHSVKPRWSFPPFRYFLQVVWSQQNFTKMYRTFSPYASSFYRFQNILGWSKFFVLVTNILRQTKSFI